MAEKDAIIFNIVNVKISKEKLEKFKIWEEKQNYYETGERGLNPNYEILEKLVNKEGNNSLNKESVSALSKYRKFVLTDLYKKVKEGVTKLENETEIK